MHSLRVRQLDVCVCVCVCVRMHACIKFHVSILVHAFWVIVFFSPSFSFKVGIICIVSLFLSVMESKFELHLFTVTASLH